MRNMRLVKHLASYHKNIFCVGDPDQSVYAWRGADWRNVHRFEQDFPDATVILLEQNYRSHQNILDAAMGVIDKARNRRKKKLFSDRGAGEKIFFYESRDDYGEAAFVVDTIAQLVLSKQFEPGDCAVMYRTNAMSRLIEEAFLQARLPYRLVGAQRFYGRREVKDMIAFMRLAHNPADEAALGRIINVPPRGIGDKTLTTLHLVARQNELSPGAVLLDLARGGDSPFYKSFTGRAALPLADFGGMLANWHDAAKTFTTAELFDRIVRDINFKAHILEDETEESAERWENVEELKRLALNIPRARWMIFLRTLRSLQIRTPSQMPTRPHCSPSTPPRDLNSARSLSSASMTASFLTAVRSMSPNKWKKNAASFM